MNTKDPDEIITLTFPYAAELGGAALSAVDNVTVQVISGADANAALTLNGAAQIVGSDVLQSMRNGVDGVAYKIRALATLSDGRRLARALVVPVRAV